MGTYQVWIRMPRGFSGLEPAPTIEHTTLREDEWLTLDVNTAKADAAIESEGWCGTFGTLSGNRVVLQHIDEPTIRADALAYLTATPTPC